MTRIAYLSPLPPQRTGVADYSRTVLQRLVERVDVDAFSPVRVDAIRGVRVRRATRMGLRRLDRYDAVIAQVGNSGAHDWIVRWLRTRPAVVVLHELVLHHLVAAMTIGRGDRRGYVEAMRAEGGEVAARLAEAAADGLTPPIWEVAPERFPLTAVALENATAVVVHSQHLANEIRCRRPDLPVHVAAFPVAAAAEHGCGDPGNIVIGAFGFITPHKRMPVVLEAFRLAHAYQGRMRLVVAGDSPGGLAVGELAARLGLGPEAVEVHRYTDGATFERLMSAVDVGVSLRHPTLGETSAIVAGLLARGIPTIVSEGGWYDELPGDAVLRVAPGRDEALSLAAALVALARTPQRRKAMGTAARSYATQAFDPERTVDAYVQAAIVPVGRSLIEEELVRSLGRAISDVTGAAGAGPGPLIRATVQDAGSLDIL